MYVFRGYGGIWTVTSKLVASEGAMNDNLGQPVAVYGEVIVAGAAGAASNTGTQIWFE